MDNCNKQDEEKPTSNIILGLALEYATQPKKQKWKLNREQIEAIINEHLYFNTIHYNKKNKQYSRVEKIGSHWNCYLSVEQQSFCVCEHTDEERARWYAKMLDIAISKIIEETKLPIE
jgi:hypothetical protein